MSPHNAAIAKASMARSLKGIALVVTLGTLLSKAGGLVRQLVIAAAFGVGAAYDAYNYAYVLPGFLLILLGGINGPFHSAMVSVLSRRPREEGAHILAALNTTVSALLLAVTVLLVLAADPLITLVGRPTNVINGSAASTNNTVTARRRALTVVFSAARMCAPSSRGRRLRTLTMAL